MEVNVRTLAQKKVRPWFKLTPQKKLQKTDQMTKLLKLSSAYNFWYGCRFQKHL